MITIKKPHVEYIDNKARLTSTIKVNNKSFDIFYEVKKEYSKYLTNERADSFLIGLLPYAIENQEDIISEAPLSNRLVYQVNNYLIPSLSKYRYETNPIKIKSEITDTNISKGEGIGTGLSSGVDSFQTISSHINLKNEDYNITHVVFLNVGSHGVGNKAEELYLQRYNLAKSVASDLNFELIHINSNIMDVLELDFIKVHTFLSASAVLAMQKLFKTYYYASGYPISEFKISRKSTAANFDLLTLSSITTENLQFYTTGIEKSRLDKVKAISSFEPSYRWLNVCTRTFNNCGECDKCIRTQLELYSIDKLELYNKVFDIDKFYNNYKSHIGYAMAGQSSSYNREIIREIRKNKHIPLSSYLYLIKHKSRKFLINLYKITTRR